MDPFRSGGRWVGPLTFTKLNSEILLPPLKTDDLKGLLET